MVNKQVKPGVLRQRKSKRRNYLFPAKVLLVMFLLGTGTAWLAGDGRILLLLLLVGIGISLSLRIADEWEKAVVLRVGKYKGLKGPGHFWLIPLVDSVAYWID